MTAPLRLLVVGVGGQGVLTVARLLGDAALLAGRGVVVGQLHGMAQRGGSVEATVVIGEQVRSSFVERADVVLGFEPLETLRALPRVGPSTHVVVNRGRVVPFALAMRGESYPDLEAILAPLRAAAASVTVVDGPALSRELGDSRGLNFVMLGALAGLRVLPFDEELLLSALERRSSARFVAGNRRALELGRSTVKVG